MSPATVGGSNDAGKPPAALPPRTVAGRPDQRRLRPRGRAGTGRRHPARGDSAGRGQSHRRVPAPARDRTAWPAASTARRRRLRSTRASTAADAATAAAPRPAAAGAAPARCRAAGPAAGGYAIKKFKG